jgi:Kef-type K+ transport system membrane component KefB
MISLTLIVGAMALIVWGPLPLPEVLSPTLVLGFLLLSAFCFGYLLERFGLPRITGYIFAGLLLGPYFMKFYNQQAVADLHFLNSLALAFIAFCAGGELKLTHIKKKIKPILYLITGVTSVVFIGVTLIIFFISEFIPFMRGYSISLKLAISAIFGVIAVARSPSSAIAIICETKSEGDYTDIILSVTIAMDVVIIMFFALVISFCEVLISKGSSISPVFLIELIVEIVVAFVLGFLLGKLIIFLIEKVKIEFPIVITAVGFLVIKFSHLLGDYMHQTHEIGINLEPLLICMAAGFTVQNFSQHGSVFLDRMDSVSYPIYIAFFAITGASINIDILKTGWFLGLIIVLTRTVMIYFGSYFSGKLAREEPIIYKNAWLGFITQAGVSLGLLAEVARRFPEIGVPIQTILIASITLNQVFGPVAFKYALSKVGESCVPQGGGRFK